MDQVTFHPKPLEAGLVEKGRERQNHALYIVRTPTSRAPDQQTPLGFLKSWGTTRVSILSCCATYMGAKLETYPFLEKYSPVRVEMPERDPFGVKQTSEPGHSDTFVTILNWVDNPLGGKSFP